MFHKFSAAPAKARTQTKRSVSARAHMGNNIKNSDVDANSSPEHVVNSQVKRQRIARACDHCRQHRVKCDEQKPCSQCVNIKAKCMVSYAPREPPGSSRTNDGSNDDATQESPPSSKSPTPMGREEQEIPWLTGIPMNDIHKEFSNSASEIQGFFDSGQPADSQASVSAHTSCLFPQLPHPPIPSAERSLVQSSLLKSQRSYYLRLFWDVCHPLLQITSETQFFGLDNLPLATMFDDYSINNALIDAIIALGMQHAHATGLSRRIVGLQQEASWPGFDYFHRSR